VLPKDVETWLPECDLIVPNEVQGGASTIDSWADFTDHAPHLIERFPLQCYAGKSRIPEEDCLEKLREVATTMETPKV
jgi:hypothetical protein